MHRTPAALIGCALLLLAAPLSLLSAQTRRAVANSIFEFHSGFWINLHHLLYQQAQRKDSSQPGQLTTDKTSPDWVESVLFYEKTLVSRDLLFDNGMIAIKDSLEDQENADSLMPTADLPASLVSILDKAAPVYRANSWRQHDQENRKWIDDVSPLLDRYGEQLRRKLSAAYQTPWPNGPIRVDVTNFASWAGAYTTNDPTRITISSVDPANQGVAALETLFHEGSHGISGKLERAISDECKRQNVLLPKKDLWHAVIFYTTGEFVRRDFSDYTPYAYQNGLWKRAWPGYIASLERDWKPYLDGQVSFDAAVAMLVKDVGEPRASSK